MGWAEEPRRHHRGPHRVLEPHRVFLAQRVQLLPDRFREAHLAQRIGDLRAGVGRASQRLQRRRVEGLQDGLGNLRFVQRALPGIPRRARRDFLQVPEIGDLPSRGDQLSAGCHEIPGENGASQGEIGHADALLWRRER